MQDFSIPTDSRWSQELETAVKTSAREAGFCLSGIVQAESYQSALQRGDRFASWVEQGRAGEMEYLKRRDAEGTLLRSALQVAIPWARSVIVCAVDYSSSDPLSIESAPSDTGWIGRYAWSGRRDPEADLVPTDYHDDLLGRLKAVEARLLRDVSCQTRCYVDTGPVVERDFAARSGIGWVGKNTCVINQERGSWLLLGIIVTSLPVSDHATLNVAPDRCGTCTRCIDACPTNALVAPREMDASLCIAYLTIEKKGVIAPELREAMGRQIFGCDICQDVCPWNRKNRNQEESDAKQCGGDHPHSSGISTVMEVRQELVNPSLANLAAMDSGEFKRWFKGSPLERTGRKRLHRNVAIAMGNSEMPEFLPKLREWSAGEDAILAEAARWAIERIQSASIEG